MEFRFLLLFKESLSMLSFLKHKSKVIQFAFHSFKFALAKSEDIKKSMNNIKPSKQGIEFVGKHENVLVENNENEISVNAIESKPPSTPNQEKRRRTLKEVVPLDQQESPAKKLNSRRSSARLVQTNPNELLAPSLDRFQIQPHLPGIRKNVVASPKTVVIDQVNLF